MKICVDENIPLITVVELRKLGHDVLDIRGTDDQGISDDLLWEKVQKEETSDYNRQRLCPSSSRIAFWNSRYKTASAE